ncbi:hypothetical protein H5410_047969 [Solanum commersonii]|uniref:At1g61320/AtMIF1 LRR domain-containing protein n=1 Tax=Solanum commersonii TaxID=4109 RepID=A0A9J5XIY0_SOLCO|nr:hypothetical protein H5410_047969 [Solanum commersonii]
MSILSKTWLQAWSTLPNLEFSVHCCKGGAKIANTTMERYRDGKISIEKFELLEFDGDSEKLFPKSLRELFLQDCNGMNVSLSSGVVNCKSLRNVFLSHVRLGKNMLQTLLNSCPLIVSFILQHCSGNLGKIKSDSLKVLKIHQRGGTWEIDAPNLVSLDYVGNQIPELKIARQST